MTIPVRPICLGCKHFQPEADVLRCDAFDEIPKAIYTSEADHRLPYTNDKGIVFEAKTRADDIYADSLFGKLETA